MLGSEAAGDAANEEQGAEAVDEPGSAQEAGCHLQPESHRQDSQDADGATQSQGAEETKGSREKAVAAESHEDPAAEKVHILFGLNLQTLKCNVEIKVIV